MCASWQKEFFLIAATKRNRTWIFHMVSEKLRGMHAKSKTILKLQHFYLVQLIPWVNFLSSSKCGNLRFMFRFLWTKVSCVRTKLNDWLDNWVLKKFAFSLFRNKFSHWCDFSMKLIILCSSFGFCV